MSQRDNSLQNVWDVATLQWVRMQQPTLEADSVTVQLPDEGQQMMANSISVAIASNQSPVPARLTDGLGNSLAATIGVPNGSELALVTRNIPSGTQVVSIASTVPVSVADTVFVTLNGTNRVGSLGNTTATVTSVSDSATSVQLLAASGTRRGVTIVNDSSAALYVKLGTTASTTSYTARLAQNAYYEVPFHYTGRIDGIWATDPNDGAARITTITD